MFEFSYCEATPFLFIAQPFNTISSLVFLVMAMIVWRNPDHQYHRWGMVLMFICSCFWHATGIPWALALDIAAIVIWLVLFVFDLGRTHTMSPYRNTLWLGMLLFLGLCWITAMLTQQFMPLLSGAFLPAALAVLLVRLSPCMPKKIKRICLVCGLSMFFAIAMRELDLITCQWLSVGSHWLWHIAAGASLYAAFVLLEHNAQVLPERRRGYHI